MDLPLHEQFRVNQWRTMIDNASTADLEALRQIAHSVLDYAITNRAFALAQAQAMLPKQQNAPAT